MAAVSRRVMQASAQVVVLGEAMRERAVAAGAPRDRVSVIPNWADGDVVRPIPHESNPLRDDLARGARFVVLYSGNIGRAHDVSTMVGAARKLADRSDIAFVFQGEGNKRAELELGTRGLPNVRFAPYQPRERLAESLSAADVHLITLSPNVLGLLEPSKLYGIMAAGRPALYVGPDRSEVARTIGAERMGACIANGDVDGLVAAITRRAADPTISARRGDASPLGLRPGVLPPPPDGPVRPPSRVTGLTGPDSAPRLGKWSVTPWSGYWPRPTPVPYSPP